VVVGTLVHRRQTLNRRASRMMGRRLASWPGGGTIGSKTDQAKSSYWRRLSGRWLDALATGFVR
jgi:hypothetical protein